jgi:hypothetical protein
MRPLFNHAIYVNASPDRLRRASHGAAASDPVTENRVWVTGRRLFDEAKAAREDLPLIFGYYAPLTFWAVATEITVGERSTRYRFARLTKLSRHERRHLTLATSNKPLPNSFIRSYAIVRTPDFLSSSLKRVAYWVIKAKPDRNDFARFPLRGNRGRWYVTRPPRAWKPGDTLFIWAGAPMLRVIGLARLARPDDGHDGKLHYFRVDYLSNLLEGPTIAQLRRDPVVRAASFLKSGPSGTVFPLSEPQGSRIFQLLAGDRQLPPTCSRPAHRRDATLERAAGFGDVETNRKVERAAVEAATRHYRDLGWSVRSVESEHRGYDLHCHRGSDDLHVEVKGASGRAFGFIMTQREYVLASEDEDFELCFVASALTRPALRTMPGGEIFRVCRFWPLAYRVTS